MPRGWSFVLLFVLPAFTSVGFSVVALPPFDIQPHFHGFEGATRRFTISDDMFWKDGYPFQIIGGDLHYFRVHPEYWEDRLLRAKILGLNTIQTYVPWNLHEPMSQKWNFEGIANLESFLKLAQNLGFLVMLRVGPYICAEWDFGGFPAWLLGIEPPMKLRSSDPAFLALVERWWGVLLPKIVPLLYHNGGPIIMVQVENEFGSYGDDKKYLQYLATLARRHLGYDIVLYTTDGGTKETLDKGAIHGEDVYAAVDFSTGEDPWPIFELQKRYNTAGKSPPLTAEFYTGWLTHWGEHNAVTDAIATAAALEKILSRNGSAVLYMAHGGTNFAFYNGANSGKNDSDYKADITSYDYDAPIAETGDVNNPKFRALRNVIRKYSGASHLPFPQKNKRMNYGSVNVSSIGSLFELLDIVCDQDDVFQTEQPVAMELVGQMFGFLLYVSEYEGLVNGSILAIQKVHDRAQVFISCTKYDNGRNPTYVGTLERWSNKRLLLPHIKCPSNVSLFILVENMGRLNYGPFLYDRKGILSDVTLDRISLQAWRMFPISFDKLNSLLKSNVVMQVDDSVTDKSSSYTISKTHPQEMPAFYTGRFLNDPVNKIRDTHISFRGWSKGVAFVNGFNIGRFWPLAGPQCTLYIPGPLLQHGVNVVIILELHSPNPEMTIDLVNDPDFTCGP